MGSYHLPEGAEKMKQKILPVLSLGTMLLSAALFVFCAAAGSSSTDVSKKDRITEAPTPSNPCDKARSIESDLVSKYGGPDFTCTTSYIKGVIIKIWCCIEGKRIVYYSFGHEYGCGESGFELYQCGSNDLPASVGNAIVEAGRGNECWALLEETENPCRNLRKSPNSN